MLGLSLVCKRRNVTARSLIWWASESWISLSCLTWFYSCHLAVLRCLGTHTGRPLWCLHLNGKKCGPSASRFQIISNFPFPCFSFRFKAELLHLLPTMGTFTPHQPRWEWEAKVLFKRCRHFLDPCSFVNKATLPVVTWRKLEGCALLHGLFAHSDIKQILRTFIVGDSNYSDPTSAKW